MHSLRAFLLRHRALALLMVMAALCLKIALPAGYMLETQGRVLTVVLCSDASGVLKTSDIVVAKHGDPDGAQQAKADAACPYTALSMSSLGGTDVLLLALALAFILALGHLPARVPVPERIAYLLPPLRGPPALA